MDYQILDWNFADQQPSMPAPKHTPGTPCPPGEKIVFGVCRKVKQDDDWDSGNDTKQETELKGAAQKEGSAFENNKAVTVDGKKYGWAMKGGKPVMVEWGSVAGEKKVGPKKPAAAPAAAPASGATGGAAAAPGAGTPAPARAGAPAPAAAPAAPRAGAPMSAADRAAYAAGGGNAASQRGMGSTTEQVVAQGRRNLGRMDQGRGRS